MSTIKDIRKQVRNVVQEILGDVISEQLEKELYKKLEARIKKLEDDTKLTMKEINDRHKDVMSYLIRNVNTPRKD